MNVGKTNIAGITKGSYREVAYQALITGGESRSAILAELRSIYPEHTSWVATVNGVLKELLSKGYTVEQKYVVRPPNYEVKQNMQEVNDRIRKLIDKMS